MTRGERAILVAGALVVAAAITGTRLVAAPWATVLDNVHWTAGYATAAALAIAGWRRATGTARVARGWFALGLSAYTLGQVLWDVQVAVGWNPFPGPSDACFVLLGPGLVAGAIPRGPEVRTAARLDVAAITIAVATLVLALYLPRAGRADGVTTLVLVAYPVLLLGAAGTILVAMVHQHLRASRGTVAMGAAVLAKGLLWMEWNRRTLDGTLADAALLNYGFSIVAIGLGVAAGRWDPQPARTERGAELAARLARLLPLALAVSAAVAVGVSGSLSPLIRSVLSAGAVAVLAIAVARQSLMLDARDRLRAAERLAQEADERRVQLERQLAQAQKLEALGTLAGGIAHDFNNILMGVYGHAQLCTDEPLSPSVRASVEDILAGCERGRDLVRRLLAFARQREVAAVPVHPEQVVAEAARLLRAALPKTIRLRLEAEANVPRIVADAAQLHQVVMNLATNASHAIGDRSGTITLTIGTARVLAGARAGAASGEYVTITVTDDGCGMDAATQRRIFEPFFTTRGGHGGTGLGLPVVHGIVSAHGGTIEVDSAPGRGTSFTIYVPACADEETPSRVMELGTREGGSGREILVVDDEPMIARALARQLQRLGWAPTTVGHPERAIELVAASPARFAAIIADYSMPALNGVELAARLAGLASGLPFVLSTGAATEELEGRPGVSAVLHKPYDREALATALSRVAPLSAVANDVNVGRCVAGANGAAATPDARK